MKTDMMESNAQKSISEKSSEKVAAESVTDLLKILFPDAQIGSMMNAKSWLISDVDIYKLLTGELICSITNGSFAMITYVDEHQIEKGKITYIANFTSKGNYESYHEQAYGILTVELLDSSGLPIYSLDLFPSYYILCNFNNFRRSFTGSFPPGLFDNVDGSRVNFPSIAIQRCPL